jgi:hypothetical protein
MEGMNDTMKAPLSDGRSRANGPTFHEPRFEEDRIPMLAAKRSDEIHPAQP